MTEPLQICLLSATRRRRYRDPVCVPRPATLRRVLAALGLALGLAGPVVQAQTQTVPQTQAPIQTRSADTRRSGQRTNNCFCWSRISRMYVPGAPS